MKKILILLLAMFMMSISANAEATGATLGDSAPASAVGSSEESIAEQIQSLVDGGMTVEAAVAQLVAANRDKAAEIVTAAINYAPNAQEGIVSAAKRAAPTESAKIDGAAVTAGSESTAAGGSPASGSNAVALAPPGNGGFGGGSGGGGGSVSP